MLCCAWEAKVWLKIRTGIRLQADRQRDVVLHLINENKLRISVSLVNLTESQGLLICFLTFLMVRGNCLALKKSLFQPLADCMQDYLEVLTGSPLAASSCMRLFRTNEAIPTWTDDLQPILWPISYFFFGWERYLTLLAYPVSRIIVSKRPT